MNPAVEWGPADRDDGRPFAHIEHNAADLEALEVMAGYLRQVMLDSPEPPPRGPCQIHEMTTQDGRHLRMVIAQPIALLAGGDLAIVGFFGHRRPGVPSTLIDDHDAIDAEMIAEFPEFPGVLGYCSMAVEDGDYGNLVLMARADTSEHWRTSARHAFASRVIAPAYYNTVRLHNGLLPGGLISGASPVLVRTKYYDFSSEWQWTAVREYQAV